MAVWQVDDDALDWELARSGPIIEFFSTTILARTTDWLKHRGYRVLTLDTNGWADSEHTLYDDIAAAFDSPSGSAANLGALHDDLRDVARQDFGWEPSDTGLVLVLLDFDEFHIRDPRLAHAVVDMYADAARIAALIVNRMLCLVHSNDPRLQIDEVGGTMPSWNQQEWLDNQRQN